MKKEDLDYADFKRKYKNKLAKEMGGKIDEVQQVRTSDYENFKKSFMPKNFSAYEKTCNFAEKIIPISPDKDNVPKLEEAIRVSHLNVTPAGTVSFAALVSLLIIFVSFLLGYFIPYMLTNGATSDNFFFIFFGFVMALILFFPLTKLPYMIANIWRMKASNQMVLSVFYIVTYMRHTPNLELAVNFAAEHLAPPLSLDFKKVLWDVETGKFDNINQSLDYYLDSWREWNPEFIESMHLIQSTLYESAESRRMDALDKSLSVILDETFEKMLHFTHDLQGPITTLHMLGIVLPILGLVILPLLTAFVPETKWYHLFALYNILLPVLVYYLGKQILSTRPTGYGGVDLTTVEARSKEERIKIKLDKQSFSITPIAAAFFIGIIFFIIGILPLLIHSASPNFDYALSKSADGNMKLGPLENIESGDQVWIKFLDYRAIKENDVPTGEVIGPYGLIASILSLFIPLSLGLSFGLYYKWRTTNLEKVREETGKLEQEFASALFQLGNRLADGIPAEIAFSSVAKVMHGTRSGKFFEKISINIVKLGMGVEDAIFDKKVGAINEFPSSIIESSMKVFVESSKKGPLVASQAVISVAEYIKSMHRVDERLKDLMADTLSSMKSQVGFLTPIISGIVVGITSMIGQILGVLADKMADFKNADVGGTTSLGVLDMFGSGGVPTFYFQAIVGLYVVEITFILSILINGIQNGTDKIGEMNELGVNLFRSTLIYIFIAGVFTIGFTMISINIVQSL
ncbi:MAG: hypothetical protein WC758_06185 [Candidatus Woesearchaeota archaeon]|jgi:hypothetical protein